MSRSITPTKVAKLLVTMAKERRDDNEILLRFTWRVRIAGYVVWTLDELDMFYIPGGDFEKERRRIDRFNAKCELRTKRQMRLEQRNIARAIETARQCEFSQRIVEHVASELVKRNRPADILLERPA